jgi:hypothetical protein
MIAIVADGIIPGGGPAGSAGSSKDQSEKNFSIAIRQTNGGIQPATGAHDGLKPALRLKRGLIFRRITKQWKLNW